jgi:hypothetical protein
MSFFRSTTGGIRPAVAISLAGAAIVAVAATALAVGAGNGAPPTASARASASAVASAPPPPTAPAGTLEPTAMPAEPSPSPSHANSPIDPAPIKVDLQTVDGHAVRVDIVDLSGILETAVSGTPADGASAEGLAVENVDARTLRLTWVDFPIDNVDALNIDWSDGRLRFVLVQPEPRSATDSVGFDRELILSFSEPISAADVDALLTKGLDTSS